MNKQTDIEKLEEALKQAREAHENDDVAAWLECGEWADIILDTAQAHLASLKAAQERQSVDVEGLKLDATCGFDRSVIEFRTGYNQAIDDMKAQGLLGGNAWQKMDVSFHTNYVLDNVLDEDEEDSYDIVSKTIEHINSLHEDLPKPPTTGSE